MVLERPCGLGELLNHQRQESSLQDLLIMVKCLSLQLFSLPCFKEMNYIHRLCHIIGILPVACTGLTQVERLTCISGQLLPLSLGKTCDC